MKNNIYAKWIFGAIYSDSCWLEKAKEQLEKQNCKIQHQSPEFTFDQTDYYASEMGTRLKRRFLSVSGIYSLESSADWKLRMVKIENRFRRNGNRRINLDPGFLDLHRVVLLSGKEGPQKIYLRDGVWADLVLLKNKGGYRDLAWTFPDLRDGRYNDFFLKVRAEFKEEKSLSSNIS